MQQSKAKEQESSLLDLRKALSGNTEEMYHKTQRKITSLNTFYKEKITQNYIRCNIKIYSPIYHLNIDKIFPIKHLQNKFTNAFLRSYMSWLVLSVNIHKLETPER